VLSFIRCDPDSGDMILAIFNFTPVPRHGYRVGLPKGGSWNEILNSDAVYYGGSGLGNFGSITAEPVTFHARPFSAECTLPPLGVLVLKQRG
jgi:1,4-alpha-glucan branching enzyme